MKIVKFRAYCHCGRKLSYQEADFLGECFVCADEAVKAHIAKSLGEEYISDRKVKDHE